MEPKANRKPGTRTYLSIWNLGLVRQLSFLPLMLAVFGVPVRAARVCDSFGNCRVYISKRPVPLRAQETPVWCWAASLSMLFAYYNYPVQQEAIVTRYFGAPLPVPGPPWILRDALNTDWTDATGKRFRVTSRITDLYGGSSFQVSNADIVGALADEKPVFYADANHALILVQTDYIAALPQPIIVAGWAIDPYPGPNFGFRQLQPSEMQASFAAIADVRDVTAVPSISRITNGASYTLEIAPQGFVTIFGTNLASAVTSWDRYIVNDQLPSSILGTSVTINGRAAFVSYVSPTQINAIVPATTSSGTISVSVATPNGTATGNVLLKQRSPGLFASSWLGRTYAVAAPVSSPRSFVAPTGAVPGGRRSAAPRASS
ncbi:MAG: papain-like cysteine protease family protein, partial [Bryobacteraceae bacterium]